MINTILESFDIWTRSQTIKSNGRMAGVNNQRLLGIDKLRELILELAVRGKLVPQDEKDEPANVLLKKILEEKKLLKSKGFFQKEIRVEPISNESLPNKIPSGWQYCRLGVLVNSILSGGTPSKNNPAFWNGDIPWASVKDLGSSKYIYETEDYITQDGLNSGSKLADVNDVIICTRMGLGKIAITKVQIAINQDLKAVKLTSFLNVDYFINYFYTLKIKGKGTTVSGIKQEELLNFIFPLPPLAEQHRIVAKVDELMALCDQLEQQQTESNTTHHQLVELLLQNLTEASGPEAFAAAWQRIATNFDTLFTTEYSIDQLKQTILQLAVMGKLVPQDPKDEPASELLKRAKVEKEKIGLTWGYRVSKCNHNIKKSEDVPLNWETVVLSDFAWIKGGKRLPNGVGFCTFQTPYIYIRVTDMKNTTISTDDLQYIDEDTHKILARYIIEKEDLFVVIVGATIGKVGKVPVELDKMHLTENAAKIMFRCVNKDYLLITLQSKNVQEQFLEKTNQQAQPKLALERIESVVVLIPPLSEQHRIVAKVDELFALCDALKERIKEAQETLGVLAEGVVEGVLG